MKIIEKSKKKKLEQTLDKLVKEHPDKLIDFIEDKYLSDGYEFHRLFLHSGYLMAIEQKNIKILLGRLKKDQVKNEEHIETLEFISYLLDRKQYYDDKLQEIFVNEGKYINIDAIFNYVEKIREKMQDGISMDGLLYPRYILESQFEHILGSFSEILEFIRRNKVLANNTTITAKHKEVSHEIIKIISNKSSIRSHLLSIMMELSRVKKKSNFKYQDTVLEYVYIMTHNLSYWKKFEIYRDLNFSLFHNFMDTDDEIELMEKVGFMKTRTKDFLHFDWAKDAEYISSRTLRSAVKLLQPMYGDLKDNFIIGEEIFSINSLIEVLKKVYELQYKNEERLDNELGNYQIYKYGEKALMRDAGILSKHVNLLRLLAFDINNHGHKEHLISFKPLIRVDKLYYLVPSHFNHVSIEKCIDKILSTEVKILNSSDGKKGYLFEGNIETFFRESKIEFAKVARDEKRGIPEFDGIFILDDHIFFYDAKASIKPENIQEAYNNLQSVFLKGYNQMLERTSALLDEGKRKIITEKTKLNLEKKKLAPFILSNHFYFNGYRDLVSIEDEEDRHIPIIDFRTLQRIISSKKVPIWRYDNKVNKYRNIEQEYNTAKDLYDYLCNQTDRLVFTDSPLFQLTEDRIAFQIVKPIEIANN